MNYYEHHIGDYAEATAHLTFVEDAAYSRLIRKYYATEKPLPSDVKAVQRLVGARSKDEREAIETILNEFFYLLDDGWHNERCDDEINKYIAGEPGRKAKKSNENNRLKNHREERARLFKELNDLGLHAPWNIGINELREMVSSAQRNAQKQHETQPETPDLKQPATAPATPATANQTPLTNTQYPDSNLLDTHNSLNTVAAVTGGGVCSALREMGLMHVNPQHADLLELIDSGASIQDFISAGSMAIEKNKGFSYALGIVKSRIQEKQKNQGKANADSSKTKMPKSDTGFAEKYAGIGAG